MKTEKAQGDLPKQAKPDRLRRKKPSKKNFIQQIEGSGGLILPLAQAYGVTRKTIYDWINKNPEYKRAMEEARENLLDIAESKLLNKVTAGDQRACEFVLRTLGKDRGYVEKVEAAGKIGIDYNQQSDDEIKRKLGTAYIGK